MVKTRVSGSFHSVVSFIFIVLPVRSGPSIQPFMVFVPGS